MHFPKQLEIEGMEDLLARFVLWTDFFLLLNQSPNDLDEVLVTVMVTKIAMITSGCIISNIIVHNHVLKICFSEVLMISFV